MKENKSLTLSYKEARIAGLILSGGELYGWDIVNLSEGDLKKGSIYVHLSRMVDKGYLNCRVETEGNAPGQPRRYYKLTGLGVAVLEAWNLMLDGENLEYA